MTKTDKKIKKMVFGELDMIYSSSKKVAKAWGIKTIQVDLVSNIVKILNDGKKEINNDFIEKYKNVLKALVVTLQKISKSMDSKSIPLTILQKAIQSIKSGIFEGIAEKA